MDSLSLLTFVSSSVAFIGPLVAFVSGDLAVEGSLVALIGLAVSFDPADSHLVVDHALITALSLIKVNTIAAVDLCFSQRQSQFTSVSQIITQIGDGSPLVGLTIALSGPLVSLIGLTIPFHPADAHLLLDLLLRSLVRRIEIVVRCSVHNAG